MGVDPDWSTGPGMRLQHEQVAFSLRVSRFTSLSLIEPGDLSLTLRSPTFFYTDESFPPLFAADLSDAAAHTLGPAGQF